MNKERIKNIKVLYYPYKFIKNNIMDKQTELCGLKNIVVKSQKRREIGKIKILFILQYVPAWEKADLLYRYLDDCEDFETFVLCVPNDICEKNGCNDAYNYLLGEGYKLINATEGGKWFDINALHPDFIVTFRPYDHCMPKEYSAKNLSRISRLCNMIYGPPMTVELQNTVYVKRFYNYVKIFFAENLEAKKFFESEHKLGIKLHLQHAKFCGMPVLEKIYKADFKRERTAWKHTSCLKILWTPRWNTDKTIGGSHFFDYKDDLLNYKKKHMNQVEIMIRPHPLMFSNFQKTGEMTYEEQQVFYALCAKYDILIDFSKSYLRTFGDTDVLITDISSIVQEFFVLGKPIIYCPPSDFVHPTKTMDIISSACYVVKDSCELLEILNKLINGEDVLRDKRKTVLMDLFGETVNNSCEQITNVFRNEIRGDDY